MHPPPCLQPFPEGSFQSATHTHFSICLALPVPPSRFLALTCFSLCFFITLPLLFSVSVFLCPVQSVPVFQFPSLSISPFPRLSLAPTPSASPWAQVSIFPAIYWMAYIGSIYCSLSRVCESLHYTPFSTSFSLAIPALFPGSLLSLAEGTCTQSPSLSLGPACPLNVSVLLLDLQVTAHTSLSPSPSPIFSPLSSAPLPWEPGPPTETAPGRLCPKSGVSQSSHPR